MGLVQQYPALNRPASPICSVCIANYNGDALLPDCLESVLAQAVPNIEIIVHDDASTDDSVTVLRKLYPQIELLASTENVGFCVSNNRMVAHARGEFILLLNNDATLCHGALDALINEAQASAEPGILTLPQFDWESGALVDRGCLLDPFCNPIPNLDPRRHQVAYVIGACLFMPRRLWNDLGGFPEWFGSIAEDMYLCGLARLQGHSVQALAASGYRHRQGATFGGNRAEHGISTSARRRHLSERNKTRVLVVLTPTSLVWPLLVAHLMALMLEGLTLSLIKRSPTLWLRVYWPSIITPLRDFRVLRQHRNESQKARTISTAKWFSVTRWQLRKVTMLIRYGVPTIR